MASILIVDNYKSSVVMTSEIFKDKVPGVVVSIVGTGKECLEISKEKKFDLIVVDFDLPDTDGITLTGILRDLHQGPILLTIYPEKAIEEAVHNELFPYADSCDWVKKPVKFDDLAKKIDTYLLGKKRTQKRFQAKFDAMLIGSSKGRGKRAPKVLGDIINLGIGGAMVKLEENIKMKVGEELNIKLTLPKKNSNKKKENEKSFENFCREVSKLKVKIAWINKKEAGLSFSGMHEQFRKTLEDVLKKSKEL